MEKGSEGTHFETTFFFFFFHFSFYTGSKKNAVCKIYWMFTPLHYAYKVTKVVIEPEGEEPVEFQPDQVLPLKSRFVPADELNDQINMFIGYVSKQEEELSKREVNRYRKVRN
jgi:hypothetical protein